MQALMSSPATFGGLLRQFREEAGLTQEQLSETAGITPLTLHRYETDQRSPQWEVVLVLATALGKMPNDFIPQGEPERPKGKRK